MLNKIAYEPHPVSPKRKAELRTQGFRIVDVRFKPVGAVAPKAAMPVVAPKLTVAELDAKMTVEDLRKLLTMRGIAFHGKTGRTRLLEMAKNL